MKRPIPLLAPAASALALLLGLAGVPAQAFDLQGHRGARGLAPENTLAAFDRALAVGVSTLELDVTLSAEGVPVVTHDTTPNPDITRDAQGQWLKSRGQPFWQQPLQTIQALDVGRINPASRYARDFAAQEPHDGERIPTLAAVFERVKTLGATQVRFNIETKVNPLKPEDSPSPEALTRAVVEVIKTHGMADRVTLQSFDWRTLQLARQIAPELPRAYLTAHLPRFDTVSSGDWTMGLKLADHDDVPAMVAAAGGRIWSPHFSNLTSAVIERAHDLNLRVIPWTVNEPTDMERLVDWGVDGLITDYPDRLRQVLAQRSQPLPPVVSMPTASSRTARAEP
jgi:glycerophosphoryl diester phosphodiesterase